MAIRIRDFLNTERIESVGDGVVYNLLLGLPNVEELNPFKMAFCPRNERFGGESIVRNPWTFDMLPGEYSRKNKKEEKISQWLTKGRHNYNSLNKSSLHLLLETLA